MPIVGNISSGSKQITRIERVAGYNGAYYSGIFSIATGNFTYTVYTCPANTIARIRLEYIKNIGANNLYCQCYFRINDTLNTYPIGGNQLPIAQTPNYNQTLGTGQSIKASVNAYTTEVLVDETNLYAPGGGALPGSQVVPVGGGSSTPFGVFEPGSTEHAWYNAKTLGIVDPYTNEIILSPGHQLLITWNNVNTINVNGTLIVYTLKEESV